MLPGVNHGPEKSLTILLCSYVYKNTAIRVGALLRVQTPSPPSHRIRICFLFPVLCIENKCRKDLFKSFDPITPKCCADSYHSIQGIRLPSLCCAMFCWTAHEEFCIVLDLVPFVFGLQLHGLCSNEMKMEFKILILFA